MLGLHCCVASSVFAGSRGYSLLCCSGFSLWWLLLLWNTGSRCEGSVVAMPGLSCPTCGIFPDQGLNLCLLHWQVDSLSLNHQGSPEKLNFKKVRITQRWVWFYTIQYIPFFVYLVGSGRLHENHSLFEQFEVSGVSTRCLEACAVQGRSHLWPFNTWEWSWSNLKHAIRLVTDFEGFLWKKESKISL